MSIRNTIENLTASCPDDLRHSEIRYRRLFEAARDGILILDAETRKITDVNPFMLALLDYTREEFLGKELWEIGLLKDEEESLAAFEELRQTDYIRYDDLPLKTKGGEQREVEIVANVYTENGRQVIQCNIRDNTDHKLIKSKLQQSEAVLADAQRIAHLGSWDYDMTDRKLCWSDELYRIFDLPKGSLENNPELIRGYIHPEDLPFVASIIDESLMHGTSCEFENRVIRPGGEIRVVHNICEMTADETGSPLRITGTVQDITDRKQTEEALRKAVSSYRNLVESSPGIVYLVETTPPYATIYVNQNIRKIGYSPEEWIARPAMWLDLVHREDYARVFQKYQSAWTQGLETELEYRILARDGKIHWWQDKGRFVFDEHGDRIGWQGVILDITATKELEMQLRQSQKLESFGLLAGGIAHDFNNMLTAINGYSDLTLRRLSQDDPLRGNLEEIRKAGERSAELTHQLLAFSRRQILKPIVIDLNEIIIETTKMLRRLIGENICLTTVLSPKTGRMLADPGQFSQILMNLAINARDAMPEGGKLTIETSDIYLDEEYTRRHVEIVPGAYVMLAVSDTGSGISDEIQRQIFEPFFTTKEVGLGTGLGLSTVYGIVRQSNGSIEVYSEENIGTTFKIYLPQVIEPADKTETEEVSKAVAQGNGTILLVEDEEVVRNLTRLLLIECGYTVIEAGNGRDALTICDSIDYKFDLLITDVVMPEMGGRELAQKLTAKVPDLRILFTSGYTDDAVVRHGIHAAQTNFIQKPFTIEDLAGKIRGILDI